MSGIGLDNGELLLLVLVGGTAACSRRDIDDLVGAAEWYKTDDRIDSGCSHIFLPVSTRMEKYAEIKAGETGDPEGEGSDEEG